NQALEKRVEERTQALASALEDAEASEQRYRQLAEFLPQIVWTADPVGAADFFNSRFYEHTGLPHDSDIDRNWRDLIHPNDRQRVESQWRHSLVTGEPFEVEFRLLHGADG